MKHIDEIKNNHILEGDFKYIANDMLYITEENLQKIDLKKTDIFALGMCFLDIRFGCLIRWAYCF